MNHIAIIGASGYVGGRLLRRLEREGKHVTCLARNPSYLKPHISNSTTVLEADTLDRASLFSSLKGIHTAFYFVHSMGAKKNFEPLDREGAKNFGDACRANEVKRIVYLGGLSHGPKLSAHLRSRNEVGEILRASGVQTIEFRSSMIIGSGSLSFELMRGLVEKLPILFAPCWVRSMTQPISVEDVIEYLLATLELGTSESKIYEIGGPDQLTYKQLLQEYARQRNLRRWIIPIPLCFPRFWSLWLGLFTPVFARIGKKLIDGLKNATVIEDLSAQKDFSIQPKLVREAISRALTNEDHEFAETRWMDSMSSKGLLRRMDTARLGPRFVAQFSLKSGAAPQQIFKVIQRIGGKQGWYYANFLWRLRGFIDLLVGGVGMKRGRRHPTELEVGDPIDLWRVEAIQEGKLLRLQSEMKLPGRAWLQFEVREEKAGSMILLTAIFDPLGVSGRNYWYFFGGFHWFLFRGLLRSIVKRA